MKKLALVFTLCAALLWAADIPESKKTTLGLYVNARDAFSKWNMDKENVRVLDVRTQGEYLFVGHAPMAVNIPLKFLVGVNDEGKPLLKQNENFVEEVKARFSATDTILIMCRSGGRSAAAVNLLAQHGFINVYTIYDGFEGDVLDKEDSYNHGKRLLNGWKNSGAPWTYDVDVDLVYHLVNEQ